MISNIPIRVPKTSYLSIYTPNSNILVQVLREGYTCHKFQNRYIRYNDLYSGKHDIIPSYETEI